MNETLNIFIVDDDPITTFGLKKILNRDVDCQLHSFKNGETAFAKVEQLQFAKEPLPDCIFLDINMPVMDGWEFLEQYIKIPSEKRTVVNILTSSIDPADSDRFQYFKAKTKHILNFMSKPILKLKYEDLVNEHRMI
ncbi:response regulator [Croceivirga thetidis]|uniref:Response regulator n=1 Tax=Croceivirga thetidis TaxID=2721623 RepID=A0ABX1GUR8_9FLAO|nr:response regulator [Croceivirga thetidis]NKI33379.1 response regulator [Croceivirga thetidis]